MKPGPDPIRSRQTYRLFYFGVFVALVIIEQVLLRVFFRRWEESCELRDFFAVMVLPPLVLAAVLTEFLYRRLGLSQQARFVEAHRQATLKASEERIEIRISRRQSNFMTFAWLGILTAVVLMGEVVPRLVTRVRPANAYGIYGFFAGFVVMAYSLRLMNVLRVDRDGLAKPRWNPFGFGTLIPWASVASCEFVVHRDTFGVVGSTRPILKDVHGKPLLPSLAFVTPADRDRLLRYLKDRFPKRDHDPYEL